MTERSSRLLVIGTASTLAVVAAIVVVVWIVFGTSNAHETYAAPTSCQACGASNLAPGEDPTTPGWDPRVAEEDAPGQLAGAGEEAPTSCQNCAKDFAPGQKGLEEGVIGPPKKIILD